MGLPFTHFLRYDSPYHFLKENVKRGQRLKKKIFSDLCSKDDAVKWPAVIAMAAHIMDLAGKNLEAARNLMRRFMWQLNDESGGIGWGLPEVMGEVMARHEGLAQEFAPILVSYIREDGNFLEFEPLQRGVIWGIVRVAQTRPGLLKPLDAARQLLPFLNSPDSLLRGLTAFGLGLLGDEGCLRAVEKLCADQTEIVLFMDETFRTCRIGNLAEEAIRKIRASKGTRV